jgi:hypothetical protein
MQQMKETQHMKRSNITHKLAAAVTAGVFMSQAGSAFAQSGTGFQDITKNINTSASTLPDLISTVAYIGGIGLGVAGIFKLKQHVDNPAQAPMKDGLIRLGAGGGLLALPMITDAMMSTVGTGTGPTTSQLQFNAATFNGG